MYQKQNTMIKKLHETKVKIDLTGITSADRLVAALLYIASEIANGQVVLPQSTDTTLMYKPRLLGGLTCTIEGLD